MGFVALNGKWMLEKESFSVEEDDGFDEAAVIAVAFEKPTDKEAADIFFKIMMNSGKGRKKGSDFRL